MRTTLAFSILVFSLAAYAALPKTVTVNVETISNSVVSFSGTATFADDKGTLIRNGSFALKNQSKQVMVAFVAVLHMRGFCDPENLDYHSHDWFFQPRGLAPGESSTLEFDEDRLSNHCPNLPEQASYVKGELLFAQFEDGTMWGKPDNGMINGDQLLKRRADGEAYLNELLDLYRLHGEDALVAEINAPHLRRQSAHVMSKEFSTAYSDYGITAALSAIQARAQNAANRRATGKF